MPVDLLVVRRCVEDGCGDGCGGGDNAFLLGNRALLLVTGAPLLAAPNIPAFLSVFQSQQESAMTPTPTAQLRPIHPFIYSFIRRPGCVVSAIRRSPAKRMHLHLHLHCICSAWHFASAADIMAGMAAKAAAHPTRSGIYT